MARNFPLLSFALAGFVMGQKPNGQEVHPELTTYRCTVAGGCTAATNYIVLDALAHTVHQVDNSYGCGEWGNTPNATVCPTEEACAQNCIQEGISDYSTIGVTTDGAALRVQMIVNDTTVSPRIYLLDETEQNYEMVKLTGAEFTFDVDVTKLPCGMNSALYLSEMLVDGGKSDLNTGGAYWGSGYCDAQCYVTPFVNGVGNIDGAGACCSEMDIWEANKRSQQLAPHPCNQTGLYLCQGDECASDGVCDKNGCSWNPYKIGQPDYYGTGESFTVDTNKPFTVVTQFPADDAGNLVGIDRIYVQDGTVFYAEQVQKEGLPAVTGITDEYCTAAGAERFMDLGANAGMGDALTRGMVLAISLWWDTATFMQWLDSEAQGAGPCNATEGDPTVIVQVEPFPEVTFSNLKWGELGSTFVTNGTATNGTSARAVRRFASPKLRSMV
ncbi:endoglucanase-like protein [Pseudomassariella vexata]|uniref:Glucanase n=1 Tax=Pseudomassariella vexata TaxID=1141098 RepID=A0A1Y2E3V0_9PEZI|nr:endoglucanase-like protein [Pseudomassariella vexata]ORY66024.1 endoglucanase-like protein [Pseudomassariella vexata]